MSPREPSTYSEQPAGLSTAEDSDSMSGSQRKSFSNHTVVSDKGGSSAATNGNAAAAAKPQAPVANASPPPPKRSLFSIASPSKRSSYGKTATHQDEPSLSGSITNSAPTILIRAPSSSSEDASIRRPLRSSMSARTIHESLHRGMAAQKSGRKLDRSVSFANVKIREYERVLGDNPSVTCGPPLSIGWRYSLEPTVVPVEDYEEGKGLPRQSSEFLVPKPVRERILKEHADVSRREMVNTVRAIQREKAQRRKTVINLSMSKTEEKMEGAKRKLKKILKPSSSYESLEAKMWDEAHARAIEKAKRLEDSIRRGESLSARDLYSVGTPCNNLLPSRRNSTQMYRGLEDGRKVSLVLEEGGESVDAATMNGQSSGMKYTPKHTNRELRRSSAGENAGEKEGQLPNQTVSVKSDEGDVHKAGKHRGSGIVAEESEVDEIFANLVLDDATK